LLTTMERQKRERNDEALLSRESLKVVKT